MTNSEPTRRKDTQEIFIDAKPEKGDVHRMYVRADKEVVENTSEEKLKEMINADLSKISPSPVSGIYENHLAFQYGEADVLKDFDYGNILVQVSIPYCLHLPNHYEMEVSLPEESLKALVTYEKVWTNRATEDGKKSDITDFYAEDKVLYFKQSTMLTPKIPTRPEEGWSPLFTGKNIEGISDKNGVYRYTRMHIQFSMEVPKSTKDLNEAQTVKILNEVDSKAHKVVNRIIDTYRHVTGDSYVRRVGQIKPTMVYFMEMNEGFYLLSPNIETAKMNRSRKEIIEISKRLANAKKPDITELLLLDARNSLSSKDFTLAIVESYQALEIYLENFLTSQFELLSISKEDCEKRLKTHWQTKDRLNILLQEVKGVSLNKQGKVWDSWCTKYDKVRNEVLHCGKEPSETETAETLDVNAEVISWIKSL